LPSFQATEGDARQAMKGEGGGSRTTCPGDQAGELGGVQFADGGLPDGAESDQER